MARISATEDIEGVRESEDVDDSSVPTDEPMDTEEGTDQPEETLQTNKGRPKSGKYVATLREVHDAFDTVNVLRYSQPCHLQGMLLTALKSLNSDP